MWFNIRAGVIFMKRFRIHHPTSAVGFALLAVATSAVLSVPATAAPQARRYALESTDGLRLHNVAAEPATLQGKNGLRVTMSEEALRGLAGMTPAEQAQVAQLAAIDGLDFANGVRPTNGRADRSGQTESCRAVHLASRLAVVPASPGDAVQV